MKPIIKSMHALETFDLDENYHPENSENFGFALGLMIGPKDEPGEESFDLVVCTPKWLMANHKKDEIFMGRHYLIMFEYNYNRMMTWLREYVNSCEADTWEACVERLSRLGLWEFEDYVEFEAPA